MSEPLTTEGEPRNTTNAIENLRWRLEKGGLYLAPHVRETLLGDVADIERAATLDAARALTGPGEREERPADWFLNAVEAAISNIAHNRVGAAVAGLRAARDKANAATPSDPAQPDELQRLTEALRPIVADWFDTGYEAGKLDSDELTARIVAGLRAALEGSDK